MIGHFRILPFLVGITAAFVISMVYTPEKQIIHQYPNPKDASSKTYKDPSGTCYKYTSHSVSCDSNEGTLKDYPVQG